MKRTLLTLLTAMICGWAAAQEPSLVNSNGTQIDTDAERAAFLANLQAQPATTGFLERFDDTVRWPDATALVHTVTNPLIGIPWRIHVAAGTAPTVQTATRGLTPSNGASLFYAGGSANSRNGKMTLAVDLTPAPTDAHSTGSLDFGLNISFANNSQMITDAGGITPAGVVHVSMDSTGISDASFFGTGTSLTCLNATWNGTRFPWTGITGDLWPTNTRQRIVYEVDGDYLRITVVGKSSLLFFHADLSTKIAADKTHFWIEPSGTSGAPVPSAPATSSITSGSPTVTVASTANLRVGQSVAGTGIPYAATISSITNATTYVLTQNATVTNGAAVLAYAFSYSRKIVIHRVTDNPAEAAGPSWNSPANGEFSNLNIDAPAGLINPNLRVGSTWRTGHTPLAADRVAISGSVKATEGFAMNPADNTSWYFVEGVAQIITTETSSAAGTDQTLAAGSWFDLALQSGKGTEYEVFGVTANNANTKRIKLRNYAFGDVAGLGAGIIFDSGNFTDAAKPFSIKGRKSRIGSHGHVWFFEWQVGTATPVLSHALANTSVGTAAPLTMMTTGPSAGDLKFYHGKLTLRPY
jgi:hypothetical protein